MNKNVKALNLIFPLWIEYILRTLISYVNIFILNSCSDRAAAAVSVCSQIMYLITIFYNMISLGIVTIVSQKLGSSNNKDIESIANTAIFLNLVLGIIMSIFASLNAKQLLILMGLEGDLLQLGVKYLRIIGAFTFVTSISVTISAILRSHQLTKYTMYSMFISNILNIIGCYIAVFQPFGIKQLGIVGVAYSAALSQLIGVIFLIIVMSIKLNIHFKPSLIFNNLKAEAKSIYSIGIPSAIEVLAGHFSSLIIIKIIASMGDIELVTRTYVYNIMLFIMSTSNSIGQGTQIMVGYYVGNNEPDKAYKICWKNLRIAILFSIILSSTAYIFKDSILSLYTDDPLVISIAKPLLLIVIILEAGRCFNLVTVNALKGAGDVKFPAFLGILTMWGLGVLGSYILGIKLMIGLIGVWISYCLDEWIRGFIIMYRWKKRKWENKKIVS